MSPTPTPAVRKIDEFPNPYDMGDHEENVQEVRETPSPSGEPQEARSPRRAADEGTRSVLRMSQEHPESNARDRLVEFDAATHSYFVNGELVPSVTQIIKDAGMIDDRYFTEYHRWRGSAAHEAITTWNKAGKIDKRTVDPKIRPYLEAALKWQADTGFVPMFIEHRMYDPIFNVCGTADMIGCFGKEQPKVDVFVDWKSNDWKQGQFTSKWQLAAYGHAFAPNEIFRRIEVVLGPDGNYGPVNSFPVDTYTQHVQEFLALSITARLRREGGLL